MKSPRTQPLVRALKFGSSGFWTRFATRIWEKEPVLYKSPSAEILKIDAVFTFELLVHYVSLCRERQSFDGLKFYVDGVRLETFEAEEFFPVAEDKTFLGYHKRMNRQFKDYGLVCDELLQAMQDHSLRAGTAWEAVRGFTDGLFQKVGLPNRFAEIGLYLGNYRKTPFGVHVDRCGVFSFPVVGKKTFRLWDPSYVEKNPELKESFQYDEFKSKSVVLKAEAGDITYWPSSHWHIAESDGSFSATWSIGIWVDQSVTEIATRVLSSLVETKLKRALRKQGEATSLSPSKETAKRFTRTLPKELQAAVDSIAKVSKAEVKKAMLTWWAEHSSKHGFR